MSISYKGIELELPAGKVAMSHSHSMDMILGRDSTQNMDWTDCLSELPWSVLKDACFNEYVAAGELFSLMHLDYQVCNGGIAQYFFNGYHKERAPFHADDVEAYGLDDQKRAFMELVEFAMHVFPERSEENVALLRAANAFQGLSYEEDALLYETIECEEDEYIYDEELGEEVENPDYFEPYEEPYREDVIHGDENFDDTFYAANDYMEELMELSAQRICKTLARDVDKYKESNPEVAKAIKESLPEIAFKKPSLASQIESAASRSAASAPKRESAPER